MGQKITEIVDTNVIVRFFVGDQEGQQRQAKDWFKQAQEGKRKLIIKPLVVAESCFVLESFYKKERKEIARVFEVFLSQKWLVVENSQALTGLWPWYRKGFHFVDSFLLATASAEKVKILSFDKKLSKEQLTS